MTEDTKYDGESDDENDDYFSCDSGIGAIKFRKRLEQLQAQSKKLENLQFQLLTIKNANYITELDTICAISVIQEINNNKKTKKSNTKRHRNYKVVFKLFTENETERAFNAVNNDFERICYSYFKDTNEASNNSLILSYQLVETTYTLFRKTLNNKAIILLIVGNHNQDMIESYRLLDILQAMIVDLCTSLQISPNNKKQTKINRKSMVEKSKKQNNKSYGERKMSLTAMIEILEEVFGGNGDDIYPLDETEFVCCMTVRIGLETIWGTETKQKLQILFKNIIQNTEDVDIIHSDHNQKPCITFDNFISYFSPFIRSNYDDDNDDNDDNDETKERFNDWKDIKHAVYKSPLSKRNRSLREKENISASKYREKLNKIEKLINLLEETVIFNESKHIKNKNKKTNDKMIENEQLFWRKKILQHREFVRFYQDVILYEIISENNKMKTKIDKLIKLNKFSKKVQFEENEWYKKNEHLLQIEQQYYSVLKKQKNQQLTMKKCERLIQEKDDEIYRLKSQLINIKKQQQEEINNNDGRNNQIDNKNGNNLNHKLLKLKGEIAQKKLEIQNQLNLITANINDENDNLWHNKPEKIKHDTI